MRTLSCSVLSVSSPLPFTGWEEPQTNAPGGRSSIIRRHVWAMFTMREKPKSRQERDVPPKVARVYYYKVVVVGKSQKADAAERESH
jgi:hypothetical protein